MIIQAKCAVPTALGICFEELQIQTITIMAASLGTAAVVGDNSA
jgi:hypothetical protein